MNARRSDGIAAAAQGPLSEDGRSRGEGPSTRFDVAVVGSGPAGLAAATAASRGGASVLVLEREERCGGILKQCIHDGFGVLRHGERLTGPEYVCRDIDTAVAHGVARRVNAFLHRMESGPKGWTLTVVSPSEGVQLFHVDRVVMATGCRERTDRQVFLQGDRPAGIFTAGQAQRLINIDGYLPGRRAVILGSGDIGLIIARRLTLEGADVVGVYEINDQPSGLPRNVAQCLEDYEIPLHLRTTVSAVHGRDRVEAVTICPVGKKGEVRHDHCYDVACDTLILSVGLIPENDMLVSLGVELDPHTHGPVVDQHRRTSLPGVYVCGNALTVYDLVDWVSECGTVAGRHAVGAAPRAASDGCTAPNLPRRNTKAPTSSPAMHPPSEQPNHNWFPSLPAPWWLKSSLNVSTCVQAGTAVLTSTSTRKPKPTPKPTKSIWWCRFVQPKRSNGVPCACVFTERTCFPGGYRLSARRRFSVWRCRGHGSSKGPPASP